MPRLTALRRAVPIVCGDEQTEQRYLQRVEAALRRQTTRYCVAPMVVLALADGRRLKPGTPVRLQDVAGMRGRDGYARCGTAAMRELVDAGRVLERRDLSESDDEPDPPLRAA